MRVAIVHDSLVEFGGAERVLSSLLRLYPQAHVYTSAISDAVITALGRDIKKLTVLPISQRFFSQHTSLFQLLAPILWRTFNLEQYDVVIASSAHLMANFATVKKPIFIQYIHSPPKNIFRLEQPTPLQAKFPYTGCVRRAYIKALHVTPHLITNSKHMQEVIKKVGNVKATCMYPPVKMPVGNMVRQKGRSEYFLIISRLDRSKSLELAIEACNRLSRKLLIAGLSNEPAYDRYLHKIAGPTIKFIGFVSDKKREQLYSDAKAFLFTPRNEDFGIAPVEAMAYGVPLIAYFGGGVKETNIHRKTGIFFYTHTWEDLAQTMQQFEKLSFSREVIYKHARAYSDARFSVTFKKYIEALR